MNFGMPTLLELEDVEANVKECLALNLQFLEINCNEPKYQANTLDIEALKRLKKQTGIYYTLHLDEFISIADPNDRIAQAYLDSVLDSIALAKALEIETLTMHFLKGVVYTLPQEKVYVYQKYRDFYFNRLEAFKSAVEKAVQGTKICLHIENTEGFEEFMQEGIEYLLKSPAFALTYDNGHIERYEHIDEAFMRQHHQHIRHMHLHDTLGRRDHIPLGQGDCNIQRHLDLVKQQVNQILIEVKTLEGLKSSVKHLSQYQL